MAAAALLVGLGLAVVVDSHPTPSRQTATLPTRARHARELNGPGGDHSGAVDLALAALERSRRIASATTVKVSRGTPRHLPRNPADAPLACLASHEGANGGPAYDQHDADDVYGRYQFKQGTFNHWAKEAGYPEWVGKPPWQAPPAVQDAAARLLWAAEGTGPWPPSRGRCPS